MKVAVLLKDNGAELILHPETATDKERLRMFRGDGRQCLRIKHTAEPEALVIEAAEPVDKLKEERSTAVPTPGYRALAPSGRLAAELEYLERNNA